MLQSVERLPLPVPPVGGMAMVFEPEKPCLIDGPTGARTDRFATQIRKRSEILAAARLLCAEMDVSKVQIRELARRSGVTPPTIYNNLGRRDEVLRQAIVNSTEGKISLARRFSERAQLPFPFAYALSTWATLAQHGGYYRHVIVAVLRNELDAPVTSDCYSRVMSAHLAGLRAMRARGELREGALSIEKVARMMTVHNAGVINEWALGNTDIETLRTEMIYGAALPLLALASEPLRQNLEATIRQLG